MAETEKTKAKKVLSEAEIAEEKRRAFNRQINFYIMRYMWQVMGGRVKGSNRHTIYDVFQTSRERFTRIINTGIVRYKSGELDKLADNMGLRKEILTGEVRFCCPYEDHGQIVDISEKDWHTLLDWRSSDSEERTKPSELGKVQKAICNILHNVSITDRTNKDFYCLCYFYKNRKPVPKESPEQLLTTVYNTVRQIDFDILNKYEIPILERMRDALSDRLVLIDAIIAYKKAENGSLLEERKRQRAKKRGL